jgi:hypothetical protein
MFRLAAALVSTGVCVVLFLSGVAGQDTKDTPKVRGQLPPGWKKIGLSDDQVQKVYRIQGQYRARISKLETELRELRTEERSAMFRVLTDDQKTKLRKLAEGKLIEPPPREKAIETKKQ